MKLFGCITSSFNGIRNHHYYYLSGPTFQHLPLIQLFSTSSPFSSNHQGTSFNNPCSSSLLVNYLINSLAFSKLQSLSACSTLSKRRKSIQNFKLKDIDVIQNATNVVEFFTQLGFQQSHIKKLIISEPRILTSRVDKTLKPKINLLFDLGFSGFDLIFLILKHPYVLRRNLCPVISVFRVVLGTNDNVVRLLIKCNEFHLTSVCRYLVDNVELLRNYCDIPSDKLVRFIVREAMLFLVSTCMFREKLIRVEEKFGIPSDSPMFLYGLRLISYGDKCIEDKFRVFRSFGWVQADVIRLIRRNPMTLTSSQGSIRERLEFLMNELGFESSYLALHPTLFTYSLKKRMLPRYRVLEVLKEKGLLRGDYSLVSAVSLRESYFLRKFVLPFQEVHQVYAQLTGSTVESLALGKQEG